MALIDELKRILEREKLYVQDKFEEWVHLAKTTHQTLDRVLATSGYLTEAQMLRVFGECLGLPVLDKVVEETVPPEFVQKIPVQFARHHNLIAIGKANGTVRVASCSPLDTHPIDELSAMLDRIVEPVLATRSEITALINRAYQQKVDVVDEMLEQFDDDDLAGLAKEVEGVAGPARHRQQGADHQAGQHDPVPGAQDARLGRPHPALRGPLQVRYRVDGILYDMRRRRRRSRTPSLSRIKIMGKMDIAERRLPQDGGATVKLGDGDVDVRISSVPTIYGERIVMRLLDIGSRLYDMEELGLEGRRSTSSSAGRRLRTGSSWSRARPAAARPRRSTRRLRRSTRSNTT
jgi:hypothetical protein